MQFSILFYFIVRYKTAHCCPLEVRLTTPPSSNAIGFVVVGEGVLEVMANHCDEDRKLNWPA